VSKARFDKFVLLVNGLVPLAMFGYDTAVRHLGPNPVEFALHTTGMLALIFLMLTLAVTPLRKITGRNYLSNFRRMLGLFSFFYACLHLTIYFVFDRSMSFKGILVDTIDRPFILLGMTCLFIMVPLAITSTNGMVKRLGADRWKSLHRAIYIAAICGVWHYYLLVKADTTQPMIFVVVVTILLGYRLVLKRFPSLGRKRAPVRPIAAVPVET